MAKKTFGDVSASLGAMDPAEALDVLTESILSDIDAGLDILPSESDDLASADLTDYSASDGDSLSYDSGAGETKTPSYEGLAAGPSSATGESFTLDEHAVAESFETSFGLEVSGFKHLEVHVDDSGPVAVGGSTTDTGAKPFHYTAATPSKYASEADTTDLGDSEDDFFFDTESPEAVGSSTTDSAIKAGHHKVVTPSKYVSEADSKVVGESEDDVFSGTDGKDVVFGRKGDDDIKGGKDGDFLRGGHGSDSIDGGSGDDFIKAGKGQDYLAGGIGDDVLDGGHGVDVLDGGSGSDVLNGGKGDDYMIYTLGENTGATDYYDGGKGTDTLIIKLTKEEYDLYKDELDELADWIAEHSDEKRSSSKQFNDASDNSPAHPIYETSFGLNVRHMEDLRIEISDEDELPADEPAMDAIPVVELPAEEPPVSELPAAEPSTEVPPSEVTAVVTGDGPIPLRSVDVSLVKGSQITLDIDVSVDELPAKYDVFMLHDLSGSFWDDLPNVQDQFSALFDSLTANGDVSFGVGSFVDKVAKTFGWGSDYVYKTDLAITSDKATVQETLDGLRTYSGYDWPEAQMEALVQSALRGDEIGFRDGAQKFVVLFTDAPYHKAGDYAEAGANDYDTELESEDYPDPAVVGKMLVDAGITPIFAVTSYYMADYQALVDEWGVGAVTELHADSSNIAEAITGGLADAPINLELTALDDDYGFVSSVEPPIYEDVAPGTYTFSVTLEIPEGVDSYSSDSMTFEITGFGEVNVNVAIEQVDITGDTTNDTLVGDAGPNGIYGMDGDDTLIGTGGEDELYGGAGNDVLNGGLAADYYTGGEGDDVFVFETGGGKDRVADFETGVGGDVLDLRRVSSISSHAEVLAAATQVGADTVIDFGNGDSVTLLGVSSDELLEEDFLF